MMDGQTILTLVVAIIGSNGLWSALQAWAARKRAKKSDLTGMIEAQGEMMAKQNDMILGLGHDRIVYLGSHHLEQGYITKEQYEDLNDYLYQPYLNLGGNGTAKKVMSEVEKLPIKG